MRQLQLIDHAIRAEADAARQACLRAERVCLLAQHGLQDDAELALAELRREFSVRPHASITTWINLADGIVSASAHGTAETLVKLRRAEVLATLSHDVPMQALVAAWLGHFLWNAIEVEDAVRQIRTALRLAAADDHRPRIRACLDVADMLGVSGLGDRAWEWFARARHHAVALRDDAAKIALAFNQSTLQAMMLREAMLRPGGVPDQRRAQLGRAVADNMDAMMEIPSDELALFARAQMLSLLGEPQAALSIYEQLGASARNAYALRERPVRLAHHAWCLSRLGRLDEGRDVGSVAAAAIDDTTQDDDAACTHAVLARVCEDCGDEELRTQHLRAADAAWRKHDAFRLRCAELCGSITEQG